MIIYCNNGNGGFLKIEPGRITDAVVHRIGLTLLPTLPPPCSPSLLVEMAPVCWDCIGTKVSHSLVFH